MFDPAILKMFGIGFLESLYMTLVSSALAYLLGLPLGIILVVTDKDGIKPVPGLTCFARYRSLFSRLHLFPLRVSLREPLWAQQLPSFLW